ncbi:retinoblastoma-like protein 1 [Tribolium madens]|uniref:retinoblastoma-like protein 1 n=1 Tax=Tribolium madens TaxID=41895 RepID=UPI001CF74C80|nr:retinoblastoma-like protein 1 [Tribolium madens]
MVLSNEAELEEKHLELCNKLHLSQQISRDAWERFETINKNFTLEGEPLHWIGCAIYVSCWKSIAATAAQNSVHTNCVNLTNLLRHCNLSIAQFFYKIKQWSDMASMPEEFKKRIEYLEGSFAVAYNVFKEYQPLFMQIFVAPRAQEAHELETNKHRNRKNKPVPSSPLKVFEFCWTLFITIKSEDTNYNNDLVTSCHLLIAICDWAFKNALQANRKDLLNPDFKGLPEDFNQPSYIPPSEAPCVVSILCPSPDIITDLKYIKEYQFKKSIKNYLDQGVLIETDQGDILDSSVFDHNYKNIGTVYEKNILNKSDFDERIFLAEYKRKLLVRDPSLSQNAADNTSSPELSKDMVVSKECLTPLTGRKYLGPKESQDSTSHVTATESISRLNNLLHGRQPAPSEALVQLFESCARNPTERINQIVTNLGERFLEALPTDQREVSQRRLQLATTLFYKFIESILQNERSIHADISAIVEKDVFYECMFACCLEIVIYSYNSEQMFPWILESLQIQPYNFVKVIELIIRSRDKLSRDTIKHLNMIEETILSSLVWKSDSLIWEAITSSDREIPKFEETALPGHMQNEPSSENSTLRSILNSDPRQILSPGPSATDRFQSPVAHSSAVNRELFPTVQSGQSLLQTTHLMIKDRTGNTRMIPIVNSETQKSTPVPVQQTTPRRQENVTQARPRRTGGVSIVFRKFYNLSGERMEHLCTHLKITYTDTKRKIWTVFEELVRKNHCELMKDRNLDQLLMCAVYMICKLTKLNKSFAEIIKSYRSQPQADSDIYRNVLISSKKVVDGDKTEILEERGDLIHFYNKVIIQAMKKFAQKFVVKGEENNGDILLSPLPASRGQVVQVFDNIFIKPLESPTLTFGNGKVLNYYFSRSPSKDLKDINKAIKGNGVTGKRLLVEGENDLPDSKRLAKRKVQSLIEERRNQNTE